MFTDRSSKHRITAAHLSMDESEKKRSALVVKLINYRNADNKTKLTLLSTDGSSSKKAAISFNSSKESIENEITEAGVILIIGGTTDSFGAAQNELLRLLSWADECAERLNEEERITFLRMQSLIDESQVYDYGGKFRITRRRYCQCDCVGNFLRQ